MIGPTVSTGGGATLFRRKAELTIDTLKITDLDFSFKVERSLKAEPNKAEIAVWNLNPQHRAQIAAMASAAVKLEAGYEGSELSQIYLGELRTGLLSSDGSDLITNLGSGDGEKAYQGNHINQSFGPKTSIDTVLYALAKAMAPVGIGNVAQVATKLRFSGVANIYLHGTTTFGPVARELTDLCKSADLEWSIQDQQLQILDRGSAVIGSAIVVSKETGMIGSPTVDSGKGKGKGKINVTFLITPGATPGRLLSIKSLNVTGIYRMIKTEHVGDTAGGDWYVHAECEPAVAL